MKRFLSSLITAAACCMLAIGCHNPQEADTPETGFAGRYFGFHFDFHASPIRTDDGTVAPNEPTIGSTLKEEDIRTICETFRPDFLQIDCKGHPGWTSYPSGCGNAMPRFEGDPLKVWRKVTREEGVDLYMHYSGVIDQKWASEHPEEAVKDKDGNPSPLVTRTNGTYADELMIPQLCELAEYGVDGMGVDGDCWGATADFDPRTVRQFEEETGIRLEGKLPSEQGMPYYDEYRDFCRDLYRRYLNHVIDSVHARYPDFRICSNWAFSDHMPEAVCADVSHLSGDLPYDNAYHYARLSARALAKQGRPWDLMAWGFRSLPAYCTKSPCQLMQEAAAVISLGGGFQVYITQKRDGSPRMDEIMALKPLADFMHSRKEWCFGGEALPQVAVLFSTYERYHTAENLFSRVNADCLYGLINLICEAGHSVTVASEHDLSDGKIGSYPAIVIPELKAGLAPETVEMLRSYVTGGGSLLITGVNTCKLLAEAGFPCAVEEGNAIEGMSNFRLMSAEGEDDSVRGAISDYRPLSDEEGTVVARLLSDGSTAKGGKSVAAVRSMGKGKVAVVSSNISSVNEKYGQFLMAEMTRRLLSPLYEPVAEVVSSTGKVDMVTLVKDGTLMLQLANANGLHHATNSLSEESIPPVADVELKIRLDSRPSALVLQPEGKKLKFSWEDGCATVRIPRIDIHSILTVKQ